MLRVWVSGCISRVLMTEGKYSKDDELAVQTFHFLTHWTRAQLYYCRDQETIVHCQKHGNLKASYPYNSGGVIPSDHRSDSAPRVAPRETTTFSTVLGDLEVWDLPCCGRLRPYRWYSTLVPANSIFGTNFYEVLRRSKKFKSYISF